MTADKERLLSPTLLLFMGTMILANIAAMMIFPLESLYVQELGANVAQIGLFFTITAIAPLLFQVLGGWLSDSLGRLQAIAIGSVCGAFSYLFYIFAPSWKWLLPSSVLTSIAIAFVAPSFQAFIAEESAEENRGRVFGITSTMFSVVSIIGPILGSAVAQHLNFRTMYVIAAALYTSAAVIRVAMAKRASQGQQTDQEANGKSGLVDFKNSVMGVFGLIMAGGIVTWIFISDGVRDVAFSLIGRLMPLYLENEIGLSIVQIGSLQSITAVVAMLFMSPAGWLSDKKGERVSIVSGFTLIAIGWFVFLRGAAFWQFIISRVIVGVGWALIDPAYSSLISKVIPQKLRGTAFGLFSTSLGLISLPAPWIGAQLWEHINPISPFYVPLFAIVLMLPVMWVKFKPPSKDAIDQNSEVPVPLAASQTSAD
jgi:MFS family permease